MKLVVTGPEELIKEIMQDALHHTWIRVSSVCDFIKHPEADAFFNLNANAIDETYSTNLPVVFINSVHVTLKEKLQQEHVIRINGWKGFLSRTIWEVAGNLNDQTKNILHQLGKKFIIVLDEPGFISARILAMIINEAHFTKEEKVSTAEEIDIAMKLGTNYPKGPFEWADEIGMENISALLNKLKLSDSRYTPAPLDEFRSS